MIYDCFIFNDELDLLELRLRFLNDTVDKFVLVESERTLSGNNKLLHYKNNQSRFREFENKIVHLIAPSNNFPAWDYEFFQRNYIKEGLQNCNEEDIIFISDADEIVNIRNVLAAKNFQPPALVEIPMNYYFLNMMTNSVYKVNLVSKWSFIKDKDIGYRFKEYPELTKHIISHKEIHTGWHFSYLYGKNICKYQEKLKAFSHQEYNTPYYLNSKRINRCISFGIDLFERPFMRLKKSDTKLSPLIPYLENSPLKKNIYKNADLKEYLSPSIIFFFLHKVYYKRIKYLLMNSFFYKKIKYLLKKIILSKVTEK